MKTSSTPGLNWRYRVAGDIPPVESIELVEEMPYTKPRALNWRYQVDDETIETIEFVEIPYTKPRALNWRYQISIDRSEDLN